MSEPAITLEDIHVSFGKNQIYEGLSLSVKKGEILTVIGGSGCGKSVLLKLVIGLTPWQQGVITVDGDELDRDDDDLMLSVRRKVGMVFQWGALFDSLDVFDNIAYPLRERGIRDMELLRSRAHDVLEMVGLPGIEDKMPAELSGGMRKRVALARAVAEEPKVLLYDEPTTGLDPLNVRRISELIMSLRDRLGVTSIVVTHDLASAFMVSDRMAMVDKKRIIAVDTPDAMRKSPIRDVTEFLEAMPMADGVEHR